MVVYTVTKNVKDLSEILKLQKANLPDNLSEKTKKEQGFVTVHHHLEMLQKMHTIHPHTIALYNNKLIGYALSMSRKFSNDIPILAPMFSKIKASEKREENYLIMGQVCVARDFRGKGVFRGLYDHMKKIFSNVYDCIITEINSKNSRSMNAHLTLGFQELARYDFEGETWIVLFIDL